MAPAMFGGLSYLYINIISYFWRVVKGKFLLAANFGKTALAAASCFCWQKIPICPSCRGRRRTLLHGPPKLYHTLEPMSSIFLIFFKNFLFTDREHHGPGWVILFLCSPYVNIFILFLGCIQKKTLLFRRVLSTILLCSIQLIFQ